MPSLFTDKSKSIFGRLIFIGFFASLIFFPFSFIFAEEKINDFDVQIKINSDASINVTETIKYDFGDAERHGIFRDIPVKYKTSWGNKSINLKLKDVSRDDVSENYEINSDGNKKSIKIGDPDILLKGEHVYKITYEIKNAINYFEERDELYFNVTGNDWPVVIQNASASVEIPNLKANVSELYCFQGEHGSQEECKVNINSAGIFTVESSKELKEGEGLTLVVDFPKGVVYQPTIFEYIISYLKDNYILFFPIIVFLISFFIWARYGKDPKGRSTIIAEYEPPLGMKPTLVGSLVDERPDYRDITAGLIYLAGQGFLKIKKIEKEGFLASDEYQIELVNGNTDNLEITEKSILRLFFDDLKVGTVKNISDLNNRDFTNKTRNIIYGLYQEMREKGFFTGYSIKTRSLCLIAVVFFSFFEIFLFSALFGIVGLISAIVSGTIISFFVLIMGKKTKLGAETKDHILGFKQFLSVTEKDRINFHNAPEKSPQQFMEFLPYAIALGVENKWAKQFENIYMSQPSWYESNRNIAGSFMIGNFVSNISNFSKSVSTTLAPVAKGAASGGFGGRSGFSGGGFGGGGGRSW